MSADKNFSLITIYDYPRKSAANYSDVEQKWLKKIFYGLTLKSEPRAVASVRVAAARSFPLIVPCIRVRPIRMRFRFGNVSAAVMKRCRNELHRRPRANTEVADNKLPKPETMAR